MENLEEQLTLLNIKEEKEENKNEILLNQIENSLYQRWIKYLSFEELILFDDYNRKDYFTLIADIEIDNDLNKKGEKKRQSVIKLI
jgi:hypothetical protein